MYEEPTYKDGALPIKDSTPMHEVAPKFKWRGLSPKGISVRVAQREVQARHFPPRVALWSGSALRLGEKAVWFAAG
jgi:hypothetical protein